MRKLQTEETEDLYTFLRSKYVSYTDVQCEIVDHLGCAIEELWETRPDLDFKEALSLVYSRFPVTGFSEILKEKEKYNSELWSKLMGEGYKKLLLSPFLLLFVGGFYLLQKIYSAYNSYFISTALILSLIVYMYYFLRKLVYFASWRKDSSTYLMLEVFRRKFSQETNWLILFSITIDRPDLKAIMLIYLIFKILVVKWFVLPEMEERLSVYSNN